MPVWAFHWPWFTCQAPEGFYPDAPGVFSPALFAAAFVPTAATVATTNDEWRWVGRRSGNLWLKETRRKQKCFLLDSVWRKKKTSKLLQLQIGSKLSPPIWNVWRVRRRKRDGWERSGSRRSWRSSSSSSNCSCRSRSTFARTRRRSRAPWKLRQARRTRCRASAPATDPTSLY